MLQKTQMSYNMNDDTIKQKISPLPVIQSVPTLDTIKRDINLYLTYSKPNPRIFNIISKTKLSYKFSGIVNSNSTEDYVKYLIKEIINHLKLSNSNTDNHYIYDKSNTIIQQCFDLISIQENSLTRDELLLILLTLILESLPNET